MQSTILELIGSSNKSVLLSAPAREGKCAISSKSIIEMLRSRPQTEVLVISNQGHFGIEEICRVYETVYDRLLVEEESFDDIWVVFPEYLATFSQIKVDFPAKKKEFINKLLPIACRGRIVNVRLLLISQSLNVADLGFSLPSWKHVFNVLEDKDF